MTEQDVQQTDMVEAPINNEAPEAPVIPPVALLAVAGVALLVAISTALVTGQFGVIGWAALAITLLSLVLVVVLAPQQVVDALRGRTLRFGGTSVLVTVIFLAVLMTVYWFVATLDLTRDLTQTSQFSLDDTNRSAIEVYAADPTLPTVEILAFFDAAAATNREQVETLLEDYQSASDGKIVYTVINPNRSPAIANQYGAQPGSLVVRNPEVADPEAAEVINTNFGFEQTNITNAILGVSASGDFRAYFISVEEGLSITNTQPEGASDFVEVLETRFNWEIQEAALVDFIAEETDLEIGSAGVDGEVLVIMGGSQELSQIESNFITDYLDNGGNLVVFASPDLEEQALASSGVLNDYLEANYGLRFESNIILDPRQSIQTAETIFLADFSRTNLITSGIPQQSIIVAPFSRSISISETLPEGAQTFDLAQTSSDAYAKTIDELLAENIQREDDDPSGPLTVVAAAENSNTGSRVVLMGSSTIPTNQFVAIQQAANVQVALTSLVWATRFDEFVGEIAQVTELEVTAADEPVFATGRQLNLINAISLFFLPFGILGIGVVVWVLRRE